MGASDGEELTQDYAKCHVALSAVVNLKIVHILHTNISNSLFNIQLNTGRHVNGPNE